MQDSSTVVILAALISVIGTFGGIYLGRGLARVDRRADQSGGQTTSLALLQYQLTSLATRVESDAKALVASRDREHTEINNRMDGLSARLDNANSELAALGALIDSLSRWGPNRGPTTLRPAD